MLNNRDFNIDRNNCDYDFFFPHNQAALRWRTEKTNTCDFNHFTVQGFRIKRYETDGTCAWPHNISQNWQRINNYCRCWVQVIFICVCTCVCFLCGVHCSESLRVHYRQQVSSLKKPLSLIKPHAHIYTHKRKMTCHNYSSTIFVYMLYTLKA